MRSSRSAVRDVFRARIVLLAAKGWESRDIAAQLQVNEGTVIGKCYKRHRHTEYLRSLREIDRQTPKALDIHLIVDNYSTHKHERLKGWLARHQRFHVHFIPTSS